MALSKERDSEKKIISLVNIVRNNDNEVGKEAFIILRKYLNHYIKYFGQHYNIAGCDNDEIEQECLFALRYKAIEDFDSKRGKFRSFAILCMKRHLFSLIKAGQQQKRQILNQSLSLDVDRTIDDNLSLVNVIQEKKLTVIEQMEQDENFEDKRQKLLLRLSLLEQEVLKLYLKQYHYEEIVEELKEVFPGKKINKKTIDNALVRVRSKAQILNDVLDWNIR